MSSDGECFFSDTESVNGLDNEVEEVEISTREAPSCKVGVPLFLAVCNILMFMSVVNEASQSHPREIVHFVFTLKRH